VLQTQSKRAEPPVHWRSCIRFWCGRDRGNRRGAMAIGRLRILEARIEKLSIGTLTVDHLNVRSR